MSAGAGAVEPAFKTFAEVVVVVAEAAPVLRAFQEVAGYELLHQGQPAAALDGLGYRGAGTGEEWLLARPGCTHGRLRLLCLGRAAGEPWPGLQREDDQPWDPGGLFDFNLRVRDAAAIAHALRERGWRGEAPPVRWRLGQLEVVEWLANGPEGLHVACIQRLAPPLPEADSSTACGEIFNTSQIVSDEVLARRFYCEGLGFRVRMVHETASFFDAENVFGLPPQLARGQRLRIVLLDPPSGPGMLELISFPGLTGRDWSGQCRPPRRGLAALRFEVTGLDAWARRLAGLFPATVATPLRCNLAPFGPVDLLAVESPEGARLELFERENGV